MPDNQFVIDLQNANDAILAADVRARIFDSDTALFATLATTKDTVTPGRFFATMAGAAGVYFGHVEVQLASVWYQTGQQIAPFLWSGTAILYPASPQDLAAAQTAIIAAGAAWVTATGFATPANVTDAQTAIITAGAGWVTADVSGLLTTTAYNSSIPANFSDLAIAETSGTVTAGNMRGTDGAITSLSGIATATNVTDAQTAVITAGAGWVTATGFVTPANLPPNFGSLAITEGGLVTTTNPGGGATAAQVWEYSGGDRALSGAQATAITSAATLAQVQAAGFTTDRNNALIAADLAARALADGRYIIDYTASTATQYDADGSVRTVFNLLEADGTTPATTAATAVERVTE